MKIPSWTLVVIPAASFAIGFALNAIVMAANGGQMPVLYPGGCTPDLMDSIVHGCMTHETHLKFLADWIVINHFGVASPGDFLEWFGDTTGIPALVAYAALLLQKVGMIKD